MSKALLVGCALAAAFASLGVAGASSAETPEEKKAREMQEIQRLLNAEVMARPFEVEEMKKIDAYIAEAMKKNLEPEPYKGAQPWLPGMTCVHLRYWRDRRNCRFYYHYYGYYYPYY